MDVRFCKEQEPQAERQKLRTGGYLIRPIARSLERAQKSCAFLLTMTYMDARYSTGIGFGDSTNGAISRSQVVSTTEGRRAAPSHQNVGRSAAGPRKDLF